MFSLVALRDLSEVGSRPAKWVSTHSLWNAALVYLERFQTALRTTEFYGLPLALGMTAVVKKSKGPLWFNVTLFYSGLILCVCVQNRVHKCITKAIVGWGGGSPFCTEPLSSHFGPTLCFPPKNAKHPRTPSGSNASCAPCT